MEKNICKKFCTFYSPEKARLKCGTFKFLEKNLSSREIKWISVRTPKTFDRSEDKSIFEMACKKCDFIKEGCDYRDGKDSSPCGGYSVLEFLLKKTKINS